MRPRVLMLIPMLVVMACVSGCGLLDSHAKQMDVLNGMAASASQRLEDGAMAQFQASGQVLEPGIIVEAWIKYGAAAYYKGLAGQLSAGAHGQLGPVDDETKASILAIYRDTSLGAEERRAAILAILERWVEAQVVTPRELAAEPPPPE